jgi:alkylation response protein AidB-like acyl-CoA dehydrogenase
MIAAEPDTADLVMFDTDEPTTELMLSEGDRAVRDRTRAVVREIVAPRASAVDREERFPTESVQALADAGLAGLLTSREYGGAGASVVAYAAALEEITAACGSTSTVVMTQMHCAHPIELAGNDEQKRCVLPELAAGTCIGALGVTEPGAGSDVAAMRTTARRDADGYVVNGAKTFITSGDRAGAIVLFATVDRSRRRDGITAFLVQGDPPGLRRGAPMHKMGLRGSSTTELFFDDCRLPVSACLGGEGNGYQLSMESVIRSRISAAAQGVGHAVGAYVAAVAWASRYGLLSSGRRDAQRIQFRLAEMRTRVAAGRVLLYATAALVDRADIEAIAQVSTAKLRCTDLGVEIATEAVDLLGLVGDFVRWGAERRLRDAKVGEIYDGTNEVQRMIVARDIRRRASSAAANPEESA